MNAVVADFMIDGIEIILRMDVIDALGGVAVSRNTIKFGELRENVLPMCLLLAEADSSSDMKLHITDKDFTADFDGYSWTVSWRWKSDLPANLKSRVSCYNKNITRRI